MFSLLIVTNTSNKKERNKNMTIDEFINENKKRESELNEIFSFIKKIILDRYLYSDILIIEILEKEDKKCYERNIDFLELLRLLTNEYHEKRYSESELKEYDIFDEKREFTAPIKKYIISKILEMNTSFELLIEESKLLLMNFNYINNFSSNYIMYQNEIETLLKSDFKTLYKRVKDYVQNTDVIDDEYRMNLTYKIMDLRIIYL